MELDRKIRRWKGGPLSLYALNPRVGDDGSVYLERIDLGREEMVPFGDGYALRSPPYEWTLEDPKVTLSFEVRDGRIECVAISSPPDGPELTQALLRRLNIAKETREIAAAEAHRLELDDKGEIVGVKAISPREPSEAFTGAYGIEAAANKLGDRVPRPGRPPTSDAELELVAQTVRDAEKAGVPIIKHVQATLHLSADGAKKRIRRARDRGLLPESKR